MASQDTMVRMKMARWLPNFEDLFLCVSLGRPILEEQFISSSSDSSEFQVRRLVQYERTLATSVKWVEKTARLVVSVHGILVAFPVLL